MRQRRKSDKLVAMWVVLLAGLAVTILLYLFALLFISAPDAKQAGESGLEDSQGEQSTEQTAQAEERMDSITNVRVKIGEEIVSMTMDEYLLGVVAAEMPASFEMEALKAQAVAARTYTYTRMRTQTAAHPDADVCSDSGCCQAYISLADAQSNWGENAAQYTQKLQEAIDGTDGMVALYDGEPIDAVFHSSSAGATVDAVSVWGAEVPYLKSVESPEGEEVPNYENDVSISIAEARELILGAYPQAQLGEDASQWFSNWWLLDNGTVDQVTVGGVAIQGTQLRSLFGLRSATFTVTSDADNLHFHVTGYGHGVGMSQYGANALAKQGRSFEEIISWYYTGVTLKKTAP